MKLEGSESRGTSLLRDLEGAYRSLSPEQQRSFIEVLRELTRVEPPLAEAAGAA